MKKILVLFTGGTIGSIKVWTDKNHYQIMTRGEAKKRNYNYNDSQSLLIDKYNNIHINNNINFEIKEIADVLSENMSIIKWNEITKEIKKINFDQYDGIIITHGTDTLGYFANYLSIILNNIRIPIILVSSNYELTDDKANGLYNFKTACDFIVKYAWPGVYTTYRNTLIHENKTRLIYGSRLLQCGTLSNDFESININGNVPLATIDDEGILEIIDKDLHSKIINKEFKSTHSYINEINLINSKVLLIEPFVGIDYTNYNFENVNAVLHTLYHSGTACTDLKDFNNIITFADCIKKTGIDIYAGPFYKKSDEILYATSEDMLEVGIKFIKNCSKEMAYVKLLVAYSLAFSNNIQKEQISNFVIDFINKEINNEFIC